MAANAAKVAAPPQPPQPKPLPPPGVPPPQPVLPQDKQDELHQNEGSDNVRAREDGYGDGGPAVGDGRPAGPAPGPAPAPAPAAPALAVPEVLEQPPGPVPAPGAQVLAATEHENVNEEEDVDFDLEEEPDGLSSLEIEHQLKEAQAKVDAAEARAKNRFKEAKEATARAVAAETRADKAEALGAQLEAGLTKMCDLNVKLQDELKEVKQQLAKKPSTTASSSSLASSSSTAESKPVAIVPSKQGAKPRHDVPSKATTVQANDEPGSPTRGPIGRVDGGEDAEIRRVEAGEQSNLIPAAELPATVPPATTPLATKPLAAKRPQPGPAEAAKKSPRLIEKAAAHPSKCYFDGRELDSGEYRCTREPIVSSSKMRLCIAPSCLAGPDACSAAAFHPFCYFDYYNILGQFSLGQDFTPFQCPACDDPAKSH